MTCEPLASGVWPPTRPVLPPCGTMRDARRVAIGDDGGDFPRIERGEPAPGPCRDRGRAAPPGSPAISAGSVSTCAPPTMRASASSGAAVSRPAFNRAIPWGGVWRAGAGTLREFRHAGKSGTGQAAQLARSRSRLRRGCARRARSFPRCRRSRRRSASGSPRGRAPGLRPRRAADRTARRRRRRALRRAADAGRDRVFPL